MLMTCPPPSSPCANAFMSIRPAWLVSNRIPSGNWTACTSPTSGSTSSGSCTNTEPTGIRSCACARRTTSSITSASNSSGRPCIRAKASGVLFGTTQVSRNVLPSSLTRAVIPGCTGSVPVAQFAGRLAQVVPRSRREQLGALGQLSQELVDLLLGERVQVPLGVHVPFPHRVEVIGGRAAVLAATGRVGLVIGVGDRAGPGLVFLRNLVGHRRVGLQHFQLGRRRRLVRVVVTSSYLHHRPQVVGGALVAVGVQIAGLLTRTVVRRPAPGWPDPVDDETHVRLAEQEF